MARDGHDPRGKANGKGKNGSLSRAAHEEISRTLVRILRYELSKYALEGQAGWVELDDLMQKCKSQIRYSREEVLSVARDSEGSQGKRFEVHPTGGWLRARYRHNGTSNGKGKEGKERRNGSHSGYSYASGTIENTGWDNYQGPESFSSTPPWSSNGILSMYFDLGFVEDMCCW
ncbi:unnamed protein product [Durusdinium trenchii]|uniref:2'-phosphotransferase n=1 Tax=Durusdinium trenchii TaxID=1381693 RepID=A0ABP0RWJ1_9DINO